MKNLRPLAGLPLIAYSIKYSLACPEVSKTVVSTDSPEIAETARAYGAEAPFLRPAEFSGDAARDYGVVRHALDALESIFDETIDAFVFLRPTSPLRPPGLIERALELLRKFPEGSSVRCVTPVSEHPFWQFRRRGDFIEPWLGDAAEPFTTPRQEHPPSFFQTGDLEIIPRETLKKGSTAGDRIIPLVLGREEMIDINYEADFALAEKWLENLRR